MSIARAMVRLMLYKNMLIAAALFFGWLGVDALVLLFGHPLEGVYYPLQSSRMRANVYSDHNWTDKASFVTLFYFALFSLLWWYLLQREGLLKGTRIAAIITAFVMVSFWVVTAASADLYDLEINRYWLVSMLYCNVSFFLYGFLGRGTIDDMHF